MELIDIFRTFHPNAQEYTLFSSVHRTFSRIDHILGYKLNLSKFKKIEIVSSIFSNHNAMSEVKCSAVKSLSCVQLFVTPSTVAYQASLSMEFSKQKYQSALPFPSPGNAMRLDISFKEKKNCKNTNTWILNNTFLNNQQVTEEIKRKIKKSSRNK